MASQSLPDLIPPTIPASSDTILSLFLMLPSYRPSFISPVIMMLPSLPRQHTRHHNFCSLLLLCLNVRSYTIPHWGNCTHHSDLSSRKPFLTVQHRSDLPLYYQHLQPFHHVYQQLIHLCIYLINLVFNCIYLINLILHCLLSTRKAEITLDFLIIDSVFSRVCS